MSHSSRRRPARKVAGARRVERNSLTKNDIPRLRKEWEEKIRDLTGPIPLELPPLRAINHRIPLIDASKTLRFRVAKCPDSLRDQLMEKIQRYTAAGWWQEMPVSQASPLLCIRKKNGKLRTVVDCRERNDNTVKDLTPFPDQDMIRNDLAKAKYRSKIDLSDAYEQVRVEPDDVHKTAFSTPVGTFVSHVLQQGDCNGPSTFQRLGTYIFRERMGRGVHPYMDDIHVYSDTIEEHEELLEYVFNVLRENRLYASKDKVELYSESMTVLGHLVDDQGIHADVDKMRTVRQWPIPKDFHDVQRFLGLVNYVAHYLPDVTAYTSALHGMSRQKSFQWLPVHEKSFSMIKELTCKAPVLKPIDYEQAVKNGEKLFLITDASIIGVGAYYGQGKDWKTCRPAAFMSKKFSPAQSSYFTWEQEILAILEGLNRWEDKLLGRPITLVTDHKSLQFFNKQPKMSNRQIRWYEYISRFNYEVMYIPGEQNKVADALSRLYTNSDETSHLIRDDWVTIDVKLDPEDESLPMGRALEARRVKTRLQEKMEQRVEESKALNELNDDSESSDSEIEADNSGKKPTLNAWSSGASQQTKSPFKEGENLEDLVAPLYEGDDLFKKILQNPSHFEKFEVLSGKIYTKNAIDEKVLCIPSSLLKGRRVTEIAIDQAHRVLGHKATRKTLDYLRRWYWWPTMVKDVDAFCKSCGLCQTMKSSTLKPEGLLHTLPVPTRPWESIGMDFMGPFPKSRGKDYLLVVICRLTSMIHLIPTVTTATAQDVAWLFLKEIVRLHGIPNSIVSDRDRKFVSMFWRELHRLMGVKLLMSTAFHPQTDGASERAVQNVSQVLRTIISNDQKDWTLACPMTEFAINSTLSSSTGFAPFELNYGWLPHLTFSNALSNYAGVNNFIENAKSNLMAAHDAIIASRIAHTHHANKGRRSEASITSGDLVYLSTKDLNLPKGRARKLVPKFIGPYKVIGAEPKTSTYTLELPPELINRRIHPRFHISRLKKHLPNDDERFPRREVRTFYDFGDDPETEWLVDEIIDHDWRRNSLFFHVKWDQGDSTWEPLEHCRELKALDDYMLLVGARTVEELPRREIPPSKRKSRRY
jgi:hypothetical protein